MCQFNYDSRKYLLTACLLLFSCLSAAELAASPARAGLVYRAENGIEQQAALLSSTVEMDINGLINRVTVKQNFVNNSKQWINAEYLFPLPDNAAVDHLVMQIGQRQIVGEIKEKKQAEQIFTEAQQAGKKASLVKQERADIFTAKVANIAPGEQVEISIAYQQTIDYKAGVFSLYFPMAITPRYAPPIAGLNQKQRSDYLSCLYDESQSRECQKKWQQWLSAVDSKLFSEQTIRSIKDASDPELLMDVNIYLHSPIVVTNISSPYHSVTISKAGEGTRLISMDSVIADRDFVLNWQIAREEKAQAALYIEEKEEEKYAALMLMPPAEQFKESVHINKEVIFVIDVSGSMAGQSIKQAKSALKFALGLLKVSPFFNSPSANLSRLNPHLNLRLDC